jgi:hypothetical protein
MTSSADFGFVSLVHVSSTPDSSRETAGQHIMGQHDYVLRGATPSSDVTTVGARVPSSTVEAQVEDEMRMIKNRARAVPPTRPVTAGLPTKRDIAAGLYITKQGLLPATITAPRSVPTVHSSGTWSDLSKGAGVMSTRTCGEARAPW